MFGRLHAKEEGGYDIMKNWYMGNWYMWFVLAGLHIVIMLLNIFEGRNNGVVIGYNIATVVLLAALGIVQYFGEKKGETGNKISKRLFIALIGLWIVITIICFML